MFAFGLISDMDVGVDILWADTLETGLGLRGWGTSLVFSFAPATYTIQIETGSVEFRPNRLRTFQIQYLYMH